MTLPSGQIPKKNRSVASVLAAQAVTIRNRPNDITKGDYAFSGEKLSNPLSNMAAELVLRRKTYEAPSPSPQNRGCVNRKMTF